MAWFQRVVTSGRIKPQIKTRPRSPMAEAEDLKSSKCRFDPDRGHSGFTASFVGLLTRREALNGGKKPSASSVYITNASNRCVKKEQS